MNWLLLVASFGAAWSVSLPAVPSDPNAGLVGRSHDVFGRHPWVRLANPGLVDEPCGDDGQEAAASAGTPPEGLPQDPLPAFGENAFPLGLTPSSDVLAPFAGEETPSPPPALAMPGPAPHRPCRHDALILYHTNGMDRRIYRGYKSTQEDKSPARKVESLRDIIDKPFFFGSILAYGQEFEGGVWLGTTFRMEIDGIIRGDSLPIVALTDQARFEGIYQQGWNLLGLRLGINIRPYHHFIHQVHQDALGLFEEPDLIKPLKSGYEAQGVAYQIGASYEFELAAFHRVTASSYIDDPDGLGSRATRFLVQDAMRTRYEPPATRWVGGFAYRYGLGETAHVTLLARMARPLIEGVQATRHFGLMMRINPAFSVGAGMDERGTNLGFRVEGLGFELTYAQDRYQVGAIHGRTDLQHLVAIAARL